MPTWLEPPAVVSSRRALRPSARKLADKASRLAIGRAGLEADDIDLLLNTGLYHDRNLGEPAMAALIQEDVGIHPEDPRRDAHGTFSFDVANGSCGVLTALQVADGFLSSGAIDHALIVAGDADPGHRMAPRFPYSADAAAVVCGRSDDRGGIVAFRWDSAPEDGDLVRARVGFERGRNLLRIERHPDFCVRAAKWAARTAGALLTHTGTDPADVDVVVANPLSEAFLNSLSELLDIHAERVVRVEDATGVHTAALLVALGAAEHQGRLAGAKRVLLVSAGAGIVVGAALLNIEPSP